MKNAALALALALPLAAAWGGSAQAQRFSNITGAKLLEMCTSRDRNMVIGCTGYIDGIADTVSFYQRLRPSDGSRGGALPAYVCVPGATTGGQLRDAVVAYARQHPDQGQRQASGLVLRALDATYLCPGEQRRMGE